MPTWWERLALIIQSRGITPERLADESGIPLKSIYGYLKGVVDNPRGNVIARLAQAAGTTEAYLRYGSNASQTHAAVLRKIPLIKLNAFATIQMPNDYMLAWDGVSEVTAPNNLSEQCYAVEITDESGGDEFKCGDILICDPVAPIEPGRVVVAVIPSATLAIFGRYRPHSRVKPDAGFTIEHAHKDYTPTVAGADAPGFVVSRAIRHVRNI